MTKTTRTPDGGGKFVNDIKGGLQNRHKNHLRQPLTRFYLKPIGPPVPAGNHHLALIV